MASEGFDRSGYQAIRICHFVGRPGQRSPKGPRHRHSLYKTQEHEAAIAACRGEGALGASGWNKVVSSRASMDQLSRYPYRHLCRWRAISSFEAGSAHSHIRGSADRLFLCGFDPPIPCTESPSVRTTETAVVHISLRYFVASSCPELCNKCSGHCIRGYSSHQCFWLRLEVLCL
jgi:hypothetical protein